MRGVIVVPVWYESIGFTIFYSGYRLCTITTIQDTQLRVISNIVRDSVVTELIINSSVDIILISVNNSWLIIELKRCEYGFCKLRFNECINRGVDLLLL